MSLFKLCQNIIQTISFKRKSRDRSVENTSDADDGEPGNEGEMSFVPLRRYLDKNIDEENKKIESKFHSDARQIEKKLKFSKPDQKSLLNWSKNWKT